MATQNNPESLTNSDLMSLAALSEADFLRQRWEPRPTDEHYLALSDLRLAIQHFATEEPLQILDYGAGGSPYRRLFPNATYKRADFDGDMDYIFDASGQIAADSGSFDLILSTQVLEHCADPQSYIRECFRLLKTGGRVLLSTHGLFEEHACPHDYQRWTQIGLERLFQTHGFEIVSSRRLTVGPRGGMFLFDRSLKGVRVSPAPWPWNYFWRIFRRVWCTLQPKRVVWMDTLFPGLRVVEDASVRGAVTYVGLLVEARKLPAA
jgi:SAM-dependent methyltransferase